MHPSNTGHTLAAYFFIDALNRQYGLNIPQIDGSIFQWFVESDPHIDHDGDGRVRGRFGQGLLETLMSILSISGDTNESPAALVTADAPAAASTTQSLASDPAAASLALDEYARRTGRDLRKLSPKDRQAAMRALFGLAR